MKPTFADEMLAEAFNFNDDDLKHNRSGKLSDRQIPIVIGRYLRRVKYFYWLIFLVPTWALIAGGFATGAASYIFIIPMIIMVGVACVQIGLLIVDLRRATVEHMTEYFKRSTITPKHNTPVVGWFQDYSIKHETRNPRGETIKTTQFYITRKQHEALFKPERFTIHVLPLTRVIVSAEFLLD